MPRATQTISNGCRARNSNKKCRFKNIPSRTAACAQDWSVLLRKCSIKSASSQRLASIFYCCNSARNWKKWKYSATASSALAPQNLGRPLALRCGAFGDMVLLTALIRVLHAEFREPVDIVTSGSWSAPLQDPLLDEPRSAAGRAAIARTRRRTGLVLRRRWGGQAADRARRHPE